jgi:hypothetical protein
MKIIFGLMFFLFAFKIVSFGQINNTQKVPKIAVFAPLYIDSAFNSKGYRYGKLIPGFSIPGVEYYYGAQKAIDSLKKEGVMINYYMFDSKSSMNDI